MNNKKRIAILGSTGSIGTQTLDIVRRNSDKLQVTALAAGSNIDLLEQQIREFQPQVACLNDEKHAKLLQERVTDLKVEVLFGMEGLLAIARHADYDTLVTAVVGMMGIRPTMAAIEAGKDVALANKETLVTAGHLIIPLAKKMGVSILPIDSEHSAIFQCLNGEKRGEVSKIILTASGGPFRGKTRTEMANVQVEDALKHPNWAMGRKITIDSATMVNKGLEVMEAKWLFDVDLDQVEVVVQPQSLIHSMVEFQDGAIMAQLGTPDMRLPIQYALFYPTRMPLDGERVDFKKIRQITFEEPDLENFRGLALAYEAARIGGSMPTIYNAANEMAVSLFLNRRIGFLAITDLIEEAMQAHQVIKNPQVDEILAAEQEAYALIRGKNLK
ncbi:MAG: 1-deoxy-D-xylulose-5-phosphate reductoisomerase [Lachnospiraceae bacterium]|nr:1-deoxy-D-xylulose-5-phosphate reductoisomerase [Lachnospiraceae bacterium]